MAISFASPSTYASTATAATRSLFHTCAANTGLLLVRVCLRGASSLPTSVSLTYGGSNMPLVSGASISNSSGRIYNGLYALPNPPIGSNLELKASWTNASNCVLTATNVFGCNTSPIAGAAASGNSLAPSVSTGDSTPNALAVDSLVASSGRTLTPGSGLTALYAQINSISGSNDLTHRAGSKTAAASSTMPWSLDLATNWALTACILLPSQPKASANFLSFF